MGASAGVAWPGYLWAPGRPRRCFIAELRAFDLAGNAVNILIVEDHADSAIALARVIRARGHDAEIAHTCCQAKQLFAAFNFKLVLMDIGLPDGNGCDLLHELINIRDAVFIAITAMATPHELQAVSASGFSACLVKPFFPAELFSAIEELSAS